MPVPQAPNQHFNPHMDNQQNKPDENQQQKDKIVDSKGALHIDNVLFQKDGLERFIHMLSANQAQTMREYLLGAGEGDLEARDPELHRLFQAHFGPNGRKLEIGLALK